MNRGTGTGQSGSARADKVALRGRILAARRAIPQAVRRDADASLVAAVVAAVRGARTVAAHLPFGSEPGAAAVPSLPDALVAAGLRVLLPVVLPDLDLDWAWYDGRLSPPRRGVREPEGARLGPAAITTVDAVVAPAVAVDRTGLRLGRGGGSYDRALAWVPGDVPVIVPLYDAEFVERLPAEPHDRTVTAVVTPGRGLIRLGETSSGS